MVKLLSGANERTEQETRISMADTAMFETDAEGMSMSGMIPHEYAQKVFLSVESVCATSQWQALDGSRPTLTVAACSRDISD